MFSKSENLVELLQKPGPWKSVIYSTKLINVWNTGWYLFQRQLYLHTPPHTKKHLANELSSHSIFLSHYAYT